MHPTRHSPVTRLAAALRVLLVLVRVDGGHLHLCLDGMETAISIHAVDLRAHHEGNAAAVAHADIDLPFPGDASRRALTASDDIPVASSLPAEPRSPDGAIALRAVPAQRVLREPPRYRCPPIGAPPASQLV